MIFLLIGIYAGVFNDSVILDRLHKSNYYQSIHKIITDNVESIILPTGLEVSVLEDVITMDAVYIGSKNTIEGALKGNIVVSDTKAIENKLAENIKAYATEKGIVYGEEQEEGMASLCKAVAAEYSRMLDFPFIQYYTKYKAIYHKIFMVGVPSLLLMAAVIIGVLLGIQRFKHKGLRFVAYGLLASIIMITVLPMILLISGAYQKLNVSPRYFYDFMVSYLKWDITVFLYIGGVGFALFAGILLLINTLKRRSN
jgi:hypothetical protein